MLAVVVVEFEIVAVHHPPENAFRREETPSTGGVLVDAEKAILSHSILLGLVRSGNRLRPYECSSAGQFSIRSSSR